MIQSKLSSLQQQVLDSFFARTTEFYLTGGAALAGFHLGHRITSGLTPAQLAWVLSSVRIDDDARIPGSRTPAELRSYLNALQKRLVRLSLPQ